MSMAEVARFSKDLASKPDLRAKVQPKATGLAAVVALAGQMGYSFTLDEAKAFAQSKSPKPLSDKQLDAIAGGGATSTTTVQTTAVATTAVEAAEVATTAVQVAEAAADVAAAAEAVVVVAAVLI
ncbi:MAG: Nif11-like leader peptide family natural product precursor [Enhydrobacter sp.]|nr:MAG: Nif11-like leader peptide family natural product precursor [Enhydrobacter sp.]